MGLITFMVQKKKKNASKGMASVMKSMWREQRHRQAQCAWKNSKLSPGDRVSGVCECRRGKGRREGENKRTVRNQVSSEASKAR